MNKFLFVAALLIATPLLGQVGSVNFEYDNSEYMTSTHDLGLASGEDIGFSVWFRTSNAEGANGMIFSMGINGSNNQRIFVSVDDSSGACSSVDDESGNVRVYARNTSTNMNMCGTTEVIDGEWHSLSCFFNNGTGVLCFLDGVLESEQFDTISNTLDLSSSTYFVVGTIDSATGPVSQYFDGEIAYLAIYANITQTNFIDRATEVFRCFPGHTSVGTESLIWILNKIDNVPSLGSASSLLAETNTPTISVEGPPISSCGGSG